MAYALLAAAQVIGLLLIPFGLPGIWLQVAALAAFGYFTQFTTIGWVPIVAAVVLAVVAEVVEFVLGGRFAKQYGGSTRSAWGAIIGGIVGAVIGVPIFLVGSVIGAFVGSFLGAVLFEYTARRELQGSMRVGWGALIGRLVATAVKSGLGVAVAAVALLSAFG